jgi:glutamate racemase
MLIGVFDSGIGGTAVAQKLIELIPEATVIAVNDHDNVPYGTKSPSEIIRLTDSAIQPLIHQHCDAIVIACNTATTVAISHLRSTYPLFKFIGIEPMVKPAALLTKTGVIAVLATPQTLKSDKYKKLKSTWAPTIQVIEPDCHNWAELIEQDKANEIDVARVVDSLRKQNVDVIVLGCTHYHWLKQRFIDALGTNSIVVLEPSDAIANRIKDIV